MNNKIKTIIAMCFIFTMIIAQTGCGDKTDVEDTAEYLDTQVTITLYDVDEEKGYEMIDESFQICDKYEKMLSKTKKGSDVDKINKADGAWTEVNDETLEVIKTGIDISKKSKGEFDITVGRLTDLWDFKAKNPKVPKASEIKKACATVDYRQIKTDGNKVRLAKKGAKIDLGGIAKGYIGDQITEYLQGEGVKHAIVNLGGNVIAIGDKPDGSAWNVGIERPYTDRTEVVGSVPVKDKTVVTSGVYERYFEVNGKKYHHIIDPKTGYPVESDVELVTIEGEIGNSMECDGYSTTCLLAGVKKGMKIIEESKDKEGLFIDKNDRITMTDGMNFEKVDQ